MSGSNSNFNQVSESKEIGSHDQSQPQEVSKLELLTGIVIRILQLILVVVICICLFKVGEMHIRNQYDFES